MVRPLQMHPHHRIPTLPVHLRKRPIPQDPRIVDHNVHTTKRLHRPIHNRFPSLGRGHTLITRNRLSSHRLDLFHHLVRSTLAPTAAVLPSSQIIHHHLGPTLRQLQRIRPTQSPSCPSHNRHTTVKTNALALVPLCRLFLAHPLHNAPVNDHFAGFRIDS